MINILSFARRFFAIAAIFCLALHCASSTVWATPLLAGGSILLPAADPVPAGPPAAVLGPVPFASATFTGTLETEVFSNDPANVGGLTFAYILHNNLVSADSIDRLSLNGFGGSTIDAGYGGPGVAPSIINRGSDSAGNLVGFDFFDGAPFVGSVPQNGNSAVLLLRTNALQPQASVAAVIDGSTADNVPILAPNLFNTVPEPSTIVLGVMGLLAFVGVSRRKPCVA